MTNWFNKLKLGLQKSSNKITSGISTIINKRKLDANKLDELLELLIVADFGIEIANTMIKELSNLKFDKEVSAQEVQNTLAKIMETHLHPFSQPLTITKNKLHVIMVVGVNGGGKTTSVGKLAHHFIQSGQKVTIAAADTFRVAAVEQLKTWSEKAGATIVTSQAKDSASVVFDAMQKAQQNNSDILLIDTAGRLQNKANLMDELGKTIRVIKKFDSNAPHDSLLVLDAITGQNASSQIEIFAKFASINGLIVTKLDGTAKGGAILGLATKYKIPIRAIGVGEQIEDLQPFNAKDYANNLFGVTEH